MKHYFLDTNVILDMLADREGFADAASAIFDAAGRNEIRLSICALSYSTIYYILRRFIGREKALQSLRELSKCVSILPVNQTVIQMALNSNFPDYEDAIQQDSTIDGIITRNLKDFKLSEIPVLSPQKV